MIKADNSDKRCLVACPTHQPCSCRSRAVNTTTERPKTYTIGIDPYDDKKSGDSFGSLGT